MGVDCSHPKADRALLGLADQTVPSLSGRPLVPRLGKVRSVEDEIPSKKAADILHTRKGIGRRVESHSIHTRHHRIFPSANAALVSS